MFYTHERNFGCRITEYLYRGLRTLTLENEIIRVTVLVDKGTDIIEFLHKPSDTDFLWRSPAGVKNPSLFVPTTSSPRGAFLDYYEGGWQEIFPAGGEPCVYKGISFGVHGEVSLVPWDYSILKNEPDNVIVKFWVRTYRTPFYLEKTFEIKKNIGLLAIVEKITNEGHEDMDVMWGHHPAFGYPFLSADCVIDLPSSSVLTRDLCSTSRLIEGDCFSWPLVNGKHGEKYDLSRVPAPDTRNHDWACIHKMDDGWYAITNQAKQVGFGMMWPKDIFPYLWYWQCTGGGFGPPFFGRVYTMALEPWTSYPDDLSKAVDAGTAVKMAPGSSLEATIKAIAYSGVKRVSGFTKDGQVISISQ